MDRKLLIMFNINSKNVLITGGASGIGKIMGRICLEKGAASLRSEEHTSELQSQR